MLTVLPDSLARDSVACENSRFSSLFDAEDVSLGTSPAAKSEEKRLFSQASENVKHDVRVCSNNRYHFLSFLSRA